MMRDIRPLIRREARTCRDDFLQRIRAGVLGALLILILFWVLT